MPCAAAAAASARLISPAAGVPPVIPVTISGARIARPSRVVDRSMSAAARSGSAQWTRWTSSSSVGRWNSAAPGRGDRQVIGLALADAAVRH